MPSETTETDVEDAVPDDEVETDDAAEEPDEEKPPWHTRHARGLGRTVVVSLVAVVLLVAGGGVLWWVRAQHDNHARDAAITLAAREAVLTLLTLNPEDVYGSLNQVLAASTGDWRQQFAQNADQFTKVVRDGQVRMKATIAASAIQNADDNRATVLVSANAVIANSESPQGYPAVYRVLMILEHQNDRWLVADLQFVA
jgi:Mce-associated membrane protein